MTRTYLDHNATTPLRPEARQAMIAAMDVAGNPSSVHAEGRAAKSLIERARAQVAAALGADGADVVFVSSATEGAALALNGQGIHGAAVEHLITQNPADTDHCATRMWTNVVLCSNAVQTIKRIAGYMWWHHYLGSHGCEG